ncbi:hypothetical protein DL765_006400 [Monosporascus sp. GIB2]|nr:hypothetical protein DL765_006400 [Monosporascus sp. GIB2]
MADPFGIIGVIGVAGQIIQIAVQFGLDWKDAPTDVRSFVTELQALKTVLSETNTNIILNQDFEDAFRGRHSALLSQLGAAAQDTDTQLMVSACQDGLETLLKDLKKQAMGHRIGWERLKGAFLAKKTREAVENLHRQCRTLNSLLAMDTLAVGVSIHKQIKEVRKEQQDWHAVEECQTILDWLTSIDYSTQQSDFINRRRPGTGQWLLDSEQFKTWVGTKNQTLFCPGIPGAGKTIATSIVVDELTSRFGNDDSIGIAYLYCNFRRRDEQKFDDLLASLLKQFAECRPSLPRTVKSFYDSYKAKRTRPSTNEIAKALQSVVALYSKTFIIVDALDESQVSGGHRARFLAEIFNVQAECGANIFATSRFLPEITDKFDEALNLEVRASPEDVRRYVEGHISHLPSFVGRSSNLQEEIKTGIVQAVDGMFLLARLHLDSLIGKRSPKALRTALSKLPTGTEAYDYAYDDAMQRIEGQVSGQEELAKQVLAWITCAKRPLATSELQHALAVEPNEPELDEDNLPQIEDMVSEYFVRMQRKWFPSAKLNITVSCVTYLSFSVFRSGACQTDAEFEERLKLNKFYDYAAHKWGYHACETLESCQDILDFLQCKPKVEASVQALLADKSSEHGYRKWLPERMTGLHLVAYFGIETVVQPLLGSMGPDLKDSYGRTPLLWAAENGHMAVVTQLLDKGADIEAKDRYHGLTPLSWAAENGHMAVFTQLLDRGADIEAKDTYGRTPLSWAADNGHMAVVTQLLDRGADIEPKDDCGLTPLSWAAYNGYVDIVELLQPKP